MDHLEEMRGRKIVRGVEEEASEVKAREKGGEKTSRRRASTQGSSIAGTNMMDSASAMRWRI